MQSLIIRNFFKQYVNTLPNYIIFVKFLSERFMSRGRVQYTQNKYSDATKSFSNAIKAIKNNSSLDYHKESVRIVLNGAFGKSIRYYVETLPRSGTHYLIGNLERQTGCGYASLFRGLFDKKKYPYISAYGICFRLPAEPYYILKTHFYSSLERADLFDDEYIHIPQISFFFDFLYSWCHMTRDRLIQDSKKYVDYRVSSKSFEWRVVKHSFPKLKRWLNNFSRLDVIRYEDYSTLDSPKIMDVADKSSCTPQELFTGFTPDNRRTYYMLLTGEGIECLRKRFDEACIIFILNELKEYFEKFYPEISLPSAEGYRSNSGN